MSGIGSAHPRSRRTATYQIDGLTTGGPSIDGAAAQDAWRQWCCGIHGTFDMSFDSDSYRGRVVRQRSATYQLIGWTSEAELITRSAREIRRDPRGQCELVVPLKGDLYVGRHEPEQRLRPGAMALVPVDSPFAIAHESGAVALTLVVSHDRVAHRLGRAADHGQLVLGDKGLPRVSRDLLVSLLGERSTVSGAEFDYVCDRVLDLFCLAVAGETRLPEQSGTSAVVDSVHRYIREHAIDPELSVASMAAAIGWSTRYIQAILARGGTSASDLIRAERLELARIRLSNPAFAAHTVASIAASVGFNSPSAFSSAYRRRFGYSPREARANASREESPQS
jgi:AraC-like DNA-binding protein